MKKNKKEEMKKLIKEYSDKSKGIKIMLINIPPVKLYNYDVEKALGTKFVNLVVMAGMN